MKKINTNFFAWFLIILLLAGAGAFAAYRIYHNRHLPVQAAALPAQQSAPKDVYLAFSDEVYGIIKQNYWDQVRDEQLTELYRLAAEKINTTTPATLPSKDVNGLNTLISTEIQPMTADQKKTFVATLANVVLNNLQPFGRSALYTQQNMQALNNEVNNVDTSTNLYNDLGVNSSSSQQQISQAYQQKSQELAKQNTPEAKQQLALVDRAYEALKTPERKTQYDQAGIEPAVTYHGISSNIYYIKMSRFSPTLLDELKIAASNTPVSATTLILDVRGNIGGAIDQLPNVLGDLIGENQTAFNFYQQGNYLPFPSSGSALPQISQFKHVLILTDNGVQSSTEMMTGALKRFHFGTVVGAATKGWGTVEYPFPVQNQIDSQQTYSVFLVRYLTLRDDDQPIEGRGIQPDVDTSKPDWQQQLLKITSDQSAVTAIKNLISK